jgi:hypothetical protein
VCGRTHVHASTGCCADIGQARECLQEIALLCFAKVCAILLFDGQFPKKRPLGYNKYAGIIACLPTATYGAFLFAIHNPFSLKVALSSGARPRGSVS